MVGGGMSCIKYILAVFNFVFVIFGVLLVVFGAQSIAEVKDFRALLEDPDKIAIACAIVGILLVIIAFLGCCGALRENQCMLMSFSVILVLIMIVELVIGGVGFAFKDQLRTMAEDGFNSTLHDYDPLKSNKKDNQIIDTIQKDMKCCGMYNFTDWKQVKPEDPFWLPESCCGKDPEKLDINAETGNLSKCTESNKNLHREGCLEKVIDGAMTIYGPLGLIVITIAILQLLGIIFACCLTYAVKKEYQVV